MILFKNSHKESTMFMIRINMPHQIKKRQGQNKKEKKGTKEKKIIKKNS